MATFTFLLMINVFVVASQPVTHTLVEELRLGGANDSVIQVPIGDLAVGRGRVYVLLPRDRHVAVFTTTGQYLGQIGQGGQGPGEFLQPWKLGWLGDTLWVSDIGLQSIAMFAPSGSVSVRRLSSAAWNASRYQATPPIGVLSDGSFLIDAFLAPDQIDRDSPAKQPLLLFDAAHDQFSVFKWRTVERAYMVVITDRGSAFGRQPLSDSPLYDIASDGRWLAMVDREVAAHRGTHEFRVTKYVAHQNSLELEYDLGYSYVPTRVPTGVRDSLVADRARRLARLFDSRREVTEVVNEKLFLPEYYAPVAALAATLDGRTWIQLTAAGDRRSRWLILDARGAVWGSVEGDRRMRILEANLDTVWGVEEDSEGLEYVVRYRLAPTRQSGAPMHHFCRYSRLRQPVEIACLAGPLLCCLHSLPINSLHAQVRVYGTVLDDGLGTPLAEAEILLDRERRAVTDSRGTFSLDTPAGRYHFEVRRLGFQPAAAQLDVVAGDDTEIRVQLRRATTVLEPVEVVGEAPRYGPRLAGFYDRQLRWPSGDFLTREDIEKRHASRLSDFFRTVPNVRVLCIDKWCTGHILLPSTARVPVRGSGSGTTIIEKQRDGCYMQLYLDGARYVVGPSGIDTIDPETIAGIEVYSSAAQVPVEFGGLNARCGVVAIWTRDGSEP